MYCESTFVLQWKSTNSIFHELSLFSDKVTNTMDALLKEEGKEERPRLFSHIVDVISHLSHNDLQDLWDTFSTQKDCK